MAIGKIAPSQVQSPTRPSTPAKPKAAETAQQTAKAGWGGGAARATSLKITLATLDEGPKTSQAIKAPKGFKADVQTTSERLADTVNGRAASWESDVSNLTLTTPGGKKVSVWNENPTGYSADWKGELAAMKKDKSNDYGMLDWSYGRNLASVGTAGKMISLQENSNDYMGGAHPNHATRTGTFDASTGKQVKLDQLLSQQQMTSLVNDVAARLESMQSQDGVSAEAFNFGGDKAALREAINTNFALVSDKGGKVKIDLAWDSGIHALGGVMAHVQVEAPNDPQFRSRVGLE